jgi:SAM-dependent methyltransferase
MAVEHVGQGTGHATDSVERLDPKVYDKREALDHYARYCFAAQFVAGKRVLDVACGLGYGSDLLRRLGAASVVGVDNSADAIAYARQRYPSDGVEYVQADAHALDEVVAGPFDVVVSFETLEHLDRPEELLRRCLNLAHADTVFVLSVPNEAHLPDNINPFHLQKFDLARFEELLEPLFPTRVLLSQFFTVGSVIHRSCAEVVEGLALADARCGSLRGDAPLPDCYLAVCTRGQAGAVKDAIVHGRQFFAEWVRFLETVDRDRAWAEEQRQAWMKTAEERAADLAGKQSWLEEQWQAWKKTAEERAAAIAEIESGRAWAEEQRQAWKKTAEERAAAIAEIESGRAWAEEQRQAWMKTAEERAAAITEIESGRNWSETQRQAWMKTAEEQAARIAQVEEERQAWMETAHKADAWVEQLERVRTWLTEQLEEPTKKLKDLEVRHEITRADLAGTRERLAHQQGELAEARAQLARQEVALAGARAQLERQQAEFAAVAAERAAAAAALEALSGRLQGIERSRGYRSIRWVRRKLLPPHSWRGRFVSSGLRFVFRVLRRGRK